MQGMAQFRIQEEGLQTTGGGTADNTWEEGLQTTQKLVTLKFLRLFNTEPIYTMRNSVKNKLHTW
jgi:hypothetical protein